MALPVTIAETVGLQNSYHGPFKSSTGAFYTILIESDASFDAQIIAFKATDPTDTFTVQDDTARPQMAGTVSVRVQSLWVWQKADILYVAAQNSDEEVYHAQFDMANDVWIEITVGNTEDAVDALSAEVQADAVSIAVEESSSNEIVIAYQGNPSDNKDMGGSFDWVAYAVSDDAGVGASWSTGNAVADTNDASEVDFAGPVIVRGTSDRMHIFFVDSTNDDAYQRTLADPGGTPSLETFPSAFDADLNVSFPWKFGPGSLLEGVVYVPYLDTDLKGAVASFVSADVPTVAIDLGLTTLAAATRSLNVILDGGDKHLVYVESSTDDMWHMIDTGSGWGGDEELFAGSGQISEVSANIYDRDGPKIGMIYLDGSTVKYNEEPITHTFGLLSSVNMGKVNSFHGPFET